MDPELEKLFWAARRALAKGATMEQINASLKEYGAPPLDEIAGSLMNRDVTSPAKSVLLGGAQAATGGLADEAAAAIEAPFTKRIGQTFKERYNELRGRERETRMENPKLAVASDVVGSLALPGPGAAKAIGEAAKGGFLARTAKAALAGSAVGAAGGAARGDETPLGRTGGAAAGAGLGAATAALAANARLAFLATKAYKRNSPIVRAINAAERVIKQEQAKPRNIGVLAAETGRPTGVLEPVPSPRPPSPAYEQMTPAQQEGYRRGMVPGSGRPSRPPPVEGPGEGGYRGVLQLGQPNAPTAAASVLPEPVPSPMSAPPGVLDIPTFVRRGGAPARMTATSTEGVGHELPPEAAGVLAPTVDEATAAANAKALRAAQDDAARRAYNYVYETEVDRLGEAGAKKLAKEAAKRAAGAQNDFYPQ